MYRGLDERGRLRVDTILYGPPSEDDWLNDPAALAAQDRLMRMTGNADADMGMAPAL